MQTKCPQNIYEYNPKIPNSSPFNFMYVKEKKANAHYPKNQIVFE